MEPLAPINRGKGIKLSEYRKQFFYCNNKTFTFLSPPHSFFIFKSIKSTIMIKLFTDHSLHETQFLKIEIIYLHGLLYMHPYAQLYIYCNLIYICINYVFFVIIPPLFWILHQSIQSILIWLKFLTCFRCMQVHSTLSR